MSIVGKLGGVEGQQTISDVVGGGASSGVLVVGIIHNVETGNTSLNKTWQEIHDAVNANTVVFLIQNYNDEFQIYVMTRLSSDITYLVQFSSPNGGGIAFVCDQPDYYPQYAD